MPHRRSSSSSPILSPPLLIIILPIILLLLLFVVLPPFLSFTSQLLRPTSVKKSWDSLNILFVLFAILCGVFAKRNDEDSPSEVETVRARAIGYEKSVEREDGSVSRQWYGFSENKIYDSPPIVRLQSPVAGVSRLRRSSSSYPDLRQEPLWETESDRYRFRFFDDFEIEKFRSPEKEQIPVENPDRQDNVEKVGEDADVKEIQVDTVEIRSLSPQPQQPAPKSPTPPVTPPPPPPPPPPATTRPKSRRTYQTVSRKEKLESVEVDDNDITGNPSPPRPPSPPAPAIQTEWEHKRGRKQRRKSEIAIMWASLLNQKKRKRKQRTTAAKFDHIQNEDNDSPRQPPPPPPPPPPPSVFHSWFKKGVGKNKKIHSVSTPPPPAPPPPPPLTSSKRWSFRKPKIPPPPPPPPATEPRRRRNAGRPPLPTRTSTFNNETLLNSGNQSPLIPIPPPPPPPPFKIPEMKFTVRGDFVKIRSTDSSRCGSPEPEYDTKPKEDPPEMEMGGTIPCPSPDVDVKASTFIARLRGEWKLEKINSMKEKQNLGLYGPGPTRGPSSSWH